MSDTYCPIPWKHLSTTASGQYRVCCLAVDTPLYDENKNIVTLRTHKFTDAVNSSVACEIRKDMISGIKNKACRLCYEMEDLAGVSPRIDNLQKYKLTPTEAEKLTSSTGKIENFPICLDIRLGNACNLKCIMCDPYNSNQWYEDWEALNGKVTINKSDFKWANETSIGWNDLIENLKYVSSFYFTGGEPTINKLHIDLLELVVEKGYSEKVTLNYHSNLAMVLPEKLLKLWEKFQEVFIGCSIDAIGKPIEYIRFPTKWDIVESNFDLLIEKGIGFWLSPTPSVLNAPYLIELLDWSKAKGIKESQVILKPLTHPQYLSLQVIPLQGKNKIIKQYKNWLIKNPEFENKINHLINFMQAEDKSDLIPQFLSNMKILDERRNVDFAKDLMDVSELLSLNTNRIFRESE